MKVITKKIRLLVILTLLFFMGCVTPSQRSSTLPPPTRICVHDSAYFDTEFSYPCSERQKAKTAGVICECMATSAQVLIETNRVIGPTSARDLLETAVREPGQTIKIIYDTLKDNLGKSAAQAYIEDIANMSVDVADRNITDRITYPNQKYRNCIANFDYPVD